MSHTYAQNIVHIVFSTKDRRKLLTKEFQPRLWSYIAGICQNSGILVHAIGGIEDHIHLLLQIPAVLPVAKSVLAIKSNSSRWAAEQGVEFAWQQGYGAFSASRSLVPAVIRYIDNQESHHRKMNFETEFAALLKKHNIAYDPKFISG